VRWWTEIKFVHRYGMHSLLGKQKIFLGNCKDKEPVWEIYKPEPSPKITSSVPSYYDCVVRFARSFVILWKAPESMSQGFSMALDV
jgi:hypothetical protein